MKKQQAIQISIPKPCSEDWQQMTPQEQGRYCDSCKKCVVDFTGFTDGQLYQYFKQHEGERVCGHFKSTQLNRSITLPPQPHSKLYRIAIALGLAIAVVATNSTDSFAKAPLSYYTQLDNYTTDDSTSTNTSDTAIIKGQVVDENGEPLINCAVELTLGGVVKTGAITDFDGNYTIKVTNIEAGAIYSLRTRYVGKKEFTTTGILLRYDAITRCDFKLESGDTVLEGDVVIMGGASFIDNDNPSPMNRTFSNYEINRLAH